MRISFLFTTALGCGPPNNLPIRSRIQTWFAYSGKRYSYQRDHSYREQSQSSQDRQPSWISGHLDQAFVNTNAENSLGHSSLLRASSAMNLIRTSSGLPASIRLRTYF